jgi:small subunit ribosomal protein S5
MLQENQKNQIKSTTETSKTPQKPQEEEEFESKLLDLARVTRVTAGGKHFRFRALVIVGNKKGKVGVGVAKGQDVAQAIQKATRVAKKNVIDVPIINGTILHEVSAKYGAARVLLKPQRKGRGLVAGGTVRVICELAGIQNISAKVLGATTNKINNARATIKALKELQKTLKRRQIQKKISEE